MDRRSLLHWVPAMIFFLLAGAIQGAWAHAILVESTPKIDSTVNGPEVEILLRFNVRIDGSRSRMRLAAPDGSVVALGAAKQPAPDTLQSTATGLKAGTYKLMWQVLAADGHMSRGEVPFTVN